MPAFWRSLFRSKPLPANAAPNATGFSSGRKSFWEAHDPRRVENDLGYGVFLPICCLVADPIVFKGWIGAGVLQPIALTAYSLIALEMAVFLLWRWKGERLGLWSLPIAGYLFSGALLAFTIGVIILPVSLLGTLVFGLGLLGLVPFGTAICYARHARDAYRVARMQTSRRNVLTIIVLTAVLVPGPPLFIQIRTWKRIHQAVGEVSRDAPGTSSQTAIAYLKQSCGFGTLALMDPIVHTYDRETNKVRRAELARVYREITGADIQRRSNRLKD